MVWLIRDPSEILVQDVLDAMIGCDGRYISCSHAIEGALPTDCCCSHLALPSFLLLFWAFACVRAVGGLSQFHCLEDIAFELDPKGTGNPAETDAAFVDTSLAFLTKRILEVAVLYVKCSWYVERRSSAESGLTAQALAAAAKTYLNDHLLTVLQLEDRANSTDSRLTLQVRCVLKVGNRARDIVFPRTYLTTGTVVQHSTHT
jgi:hypothetical protein